MDEITPISVRDIREIDIAKIEITQSAFNIYA